MSRGRQLWILALLAAMAWPAGAATVVALAEAFVRERLAPILQPEDRLSIRIDAPDRRLGLDNCARPVQFTPSRPLAPGPFRLLARCDGPRRWQVNLAGHAEILRPIWISAVPLGRGTPLSLDQLTRRHWPLSRLSGSGISDVTPWLGYRLSRNIGAGQPLLSEWLEAPLVIREGDAVTISVRRGAVAVESPGIALEDGAAGRQIRVRNARSGREIRAQVVGRGRVEVP